MKYEIKSTAVFDKRLRNLKQLFNLSDRDYLEAIQEIKATMRLLENGGSLPEVYFDHELRDEPWRGFREYHVLDDLLVVYYKVEAKKRIRFTTIVSHFKLRTGNY